MCPTRQVPPSDPSQDPVADAVVRALDELAILRRGRGGPGWMGGPPSPAGRHGGPHDDPHDGGHGGPPWMHGRGGGPGATPGAAPGDATDGDGQRSRGRHPGHRARMMAVHRALSVLADAPEPMSITELGEAIGIDQPRASRIVQMLQADALVRREPDPRDARRSTIAITPKGRTHADEHRARRAAPVAEALGALGDHERAQLATLLGRLVQAWPRP